MSYTTRQIASFHMNAPCNMLPQQTTKHVEHKVSKVPVDLHDYHQQPTSGWMRPRYTQGTTSDANHNQIPFNKQQPVAHNNKATNDKQSVVMSKNDFDKPHLHVRGFNKVCDATRQQITHTASNGVYRIDVYDPKGYVLVQNDKTNDQQLRVKTRFLEDKHGHGLRTQKTQHATLISGGRVYTRAEIDHYFKGAFVDLVSKLLSTELRIHELKLNATTTIILHYPNRNDVVVSVDEKYATKMKELEDQLRELFDCAISTALPPQGIHDNGTGEHEEKETKQVI